MKWQAKCSLEEETRSVYGLFANCSTNSEMATDVSATDILATEVWESVDRATDVLVADILPTNYEL